MFTLLVWLTACTGGTLTVPDDNGAAADTDLGDTDTSPPDPDRYPLDGILTVAHVQAKGTHNSYHIEPDLVLDASHRYTHQPLDLQLEDQGVRQFELDLHYRRDQGFEVFHLPGIDEQTTCRALASCLQTIKDWSDHNRDHIPIMVWMEPKDEDLDWLFPDLLAFSDRYDELEEVILSVWPRPRIITPDEVRGAHATLPDAIGADGWPTLGATRGRILFSLLDSEAHRDAYLQGANDLRGRLMFVDADSPGDPFAATFKINDGTSTEATDRVGQGFLVTSNVDGAGNGDAENEADAVASLAAGPHFLSSDLPAPVDGKGYSLHIPGGTPARCNPVSAPPSCTSRALESLP